MYECAFQNGEFHLSSERTSLKEIRQEGN